MRMNTGECEFGSIPLPNATWLISVIADFHGSYGSVHPYIALVLCVVGTLMNTVTVIVLTRPSMVSPVNVLLCAVALCDIFVMVSYLVFVLHFLIAAANRCEPSDYSFAWAIFTMIHAHVSVIFHAASIWLTVSLAQIRVLTISRATSGPSVAITSKFTALLGVATCVVMALVNTPNFLTFRVVELPSAMLLSCLLPADADYADPSAFSPNVTERLVYMMAFWSNGMLFKVVPCFLLTISIVALLKLIADVSHRRKSLAQVMKKKKMPKDHTTPMLVAVLSIFLVAEMPQGIMLVLTAVYSSDTFQKKIYVPLGDFMDLLSLLNSAVNFIIYCAMSRKFRSVFLQLFFSWLPSRFLREFHEMTPGFDYQDISQHKPSRITDLTRTEQLALASSTHRPSATSAILTTSRDDLCYQRMYGGNLLTVGSPVRKLPSVERKISEEAPPMLVVPAPSAVPQMESGAEKRRISFNFASRLNRRNTASVAESPPPTPLKEPGAVDRLRKLFKKREHVLLVPDSSPQRRIGLMQMETGMIY
ncbi:hypothetical protein QR680_005433 [Steinernema hermaphroditum]|uniref:G-protein coupled receptors family 1 profile domain-containing protein n=1 Tax=Steinernema hermaphroditum TaxID=289476 RepID=A0AA39HT34_9BILA|nr:hypothetical protein QR680_005433 [Steinernema hermaphroditum]